MSPSNTWTHTICEACWHDWRGGMLFPIQQADRSPHRCCYCGRMVRDCVTTTDDPDLVACRGNHKRKE